MYSHSNPLPSAIEIGKGVMLDSLHPSFLAKLISRKLCVLPARVNEDADYFPSDQSRNSQCLDVLLPS